MSRTKHKNLKHLAPGQIRCREVTLLPWEISEKYTTRRIYYEIIKKHGSVWELKAVLVSKRYDKDKVLMWPVDEAALKPWDVHIEGGKIAREFKYITNNKDMFLRHYNILYGNNK